MIEKEEGEKVATIGEQLKTARTSKGMTLEEVQQITKIQKRYLEAIESNDFDAMPGTYYVRSFIRQYAGAVGINGDALVNAYDGKPASMEEVQFEEVRGSRTAHHQEKSTITSVKSSVPLVLLSIVAVAIIGTVVYFTWKEQSNGPMINRPEEVQVDGNTAESSQTKESSAESSAEQVTESSVKEEIKKMSINFGSESGSEVNMSLENAVGPIKVTFEGVNGPCWVGVSVDGAGVFNQTLQAGETAEATLPDATALTRIVLGASKNIKIKVNGEELNFNPNGTPAVQRNLNLAIAYQ